MQQYVNRTHLLLLAGYAIPYIFLAMTEDFTFGTLWLYGVMLICLPLLTSIATKKRYLWTIVIGNVLNFLTSYICIACQNADHWDWYFKPFTAKLLLIVVSVIMLVIQSLFFWYFIKK